MFVNLPYSTTVNTDHLLMYRMSKSQKGENVLTLIFALNRGDDGELHSTSFIGDAASKAMDILNQSLTNIEIGV